MKDNKTKGKLVVCRRCKSPNVFRSEGRLVIGKRVKRGLVHQCRQCGYQWVK